MRPESVTRELEDDDGNNLELHGRCHRKIPTVDSYLEVSDVWFTMLCDQLEESGIVISSSMGFGKAFTPESPLDSDVRKLG